MDKSIICVDKEQCTGCGACYNICPTQAIRMKADSEGFLFPAIDEALCVNCGKCLNHCPVHTPQYDNSASPECYAVLAEDTIRSVSSSGGIFTLLAEWIIDQGGAVCGAAYTPDQYNVEHIIVTSREELGLLRGSKYVQSNTGNIYQEVKKYLNSDRPVLFTGTPCQVAAIHKLFGKSNNLYTLDLVCHGVPSPEVYKAFIQEQEQKFGSKAVRVCFRDKSTTNWGHSTTIDFANGEKYQKIRNECPYLNSFLKLLSLRALSFRSIASPGRYDNC